MIKTEISRSDPQFLVSCKNYLSLAGWKRDEVIDGLLSVWHRDEPNAFDWEILLPETVDLSDYNKQVDEVVDQLASYERRTKEEVEGALRRYYFDSISVRVIHEDVKDGSIPLIGGVMLNQTVSDLMASVAQSSINKRRNFTGKRSAEVIEYINDLRLGQTEVGSYIVNILAPLNIVFTPQDDLDQTSFGSIVTKTLTRSLSALQASISKYLETGNLNAFDDAVSSGVSANLCEALVGISGEKSNRDFSITVRPSHLNQSSPPERSSFAFEKMHTEIIKKAAEYFKDYFAIEKYTVRGVVKKLDRDPDSETGTITVPSLVNGIERLVEIDLLTAEDYRIAIAAHESKSIVTCSGTLNVAKRTRLLDPSDFRVLKQHKLPMGK